MVEYSDPILIKGQYQIVALVFDGENAPEQIVGYVVMTTSGNKLRHEASLDAAKTWLEEVLIAEKEKANNLTGPHAPTLGIRRSGA